MFLIFICKIKQTLLEVSKSSVCAEAHYVLCFNYKKSITKVYIQYKNPREDKFNI